MRSHISSRCVYPHKKAKFFFCANLMIAQFFFLIFWNSLWLQLYNLFLWTILSYGWKEQNGMIWYIGVFFVFFSEFWKWHSFLWDSLHILAELPEIATACHSCIEMLILSHWQCRIRLKLSKTCWFFVYISWK